MKYTGGFWGPFDEAVKEVSFKVVMLNLIDAIKINNWLERSCMNVRHKLIVYALIILGFSGCGYRVKPLVPLKSPSFNNNEQFIEFDYRVFNKKDNRKYLGCNPIAQGYQPIQITFTNNTSRSFDITQESFNCLCTDPKIVASAMHMSPVQGAAYGGLGWLGLTAPYGVLLPGLCLTCIFWPAVPLVSKLLAGGVLVLMLSPLVIFPTLASMRCTQINEAMSDYFVKIGFKDQVVQPFTVMNNLIFISTSQASQRFAVTVIDTKTREAFVLTSVRQRINFNDSESK